MSGQVDPMLPTPLSSLGLIAYLRNHARPGAVLDVGAYLGDFAENALKTGRFSKAYLFEPNPANLAELRRKFVAPSPVVVIPKAVGAVGRTATFHSGTDPTTGSLLSFADHTTASTDLDVEVTTLDLETFQGVVSVIKIDTQGGDLDVLRGAERVIAEHKPIVVIELIFMPLYERQADPFELMQWLAARGYAMAGFYNEHYGNGWLAFADAIFIPKTAAPAVPPRFDAVPEPGALQNEIDMLRRVCAERLDLINRLDGDLRRASGLPER